MEETKIAKCCGNGVTKAEFNEAVSEQEATKRDLKELKKYFWIQLAAIGLIIISTAATSYSLLTAIMNKREIA